MKEKIKKYLKEIIKFTILAVIILNVVSYYKGMDLNKEKLDIKSFTLLDGLEYKVKEDKTILVHFWATWCPICKIEAPNIQKLSQNYEVITIATQSGSNEEIQEYLKENNISFKVVNDEDGELSRKFNIKGFPTSFIYDKDKNLKFTDVGYTSTLGLYSRMLLSE